MLEKVFILTLLVLNKGSIEKPENEKTEKIPWVSIIGPKLIKEYKKLV